MIVLITASIVIVGGGIAYLIWLKTRPKKETWKAKVYQVSAGFKTVKTCKDGKIISKVNLHDMRPYAEDILEKIQKEPGITVFRLKKLNIVTPPVVGDCVDYWGKRKKEVSVVLHQGVATILTKGYERDHGNLVFEPLPHSRTNMIMTQMAVRKDRLQKNKDILEAITPWIVTGICMLGLIAISYIIGNSFVEASEFLDHSTANLNSMHKRVIDSELEIERLRLGLEPKPHDIGQQDPDIIIEDG